MRIPIEGSYNSGYTTHSREISLELKTKQVQQGHPVCQVRQVRQQMRKERISPFNTYSKESISPMRHTGECMNRRVARASRLDDRGWGKGRIRQLYAWDEAMCSELQLCATKICYDLVSCWVGRGYFDSVSCNEYQQLVTYVDIHFEYQNQSNHMQRALRGRGKIETFWEKG